ncbi:LOW QUALITY PROTEIN: golgin subfamily A member 6-like protein 6 [Cydia pomonella]|uniref:LOW QUALITY PROTEIN: golgin subfamily A member 6-like protein 6 n=1 Tax=Cydia pomonella TaxID=82600 RepID=UPI002ADE12BE|nr:LOW QUALITY PROTEIN: golgin subfamily A member 6-like protein 6 [Cydia pomonella]
MVYYYTSGNVKMVRNILIDYGSAVAVVPHEYMKSYIDKCPKDTEDSKLGWVAETFLGIQKHGQFLKDIAFHLPEELSDQDKDFFMILFHAVIFQIKPKDVHLLYKCLFNLSKPLLDTFTSFLSNDEVLTFLAQVGQDYYDANYITEKITTPLYTWQPYISEMANTYAEYVKKMESRRIKPPTVPIAPSLLNRKGLNSASRTTRPLPSSPVSLPHVSKPKMKRIVSRNDIDEKLKKSYEKNKQKADHLLNGVKNIECHYAMIKSNAYFQKIDSIKEEINNSMKPLPKIQSTNSIKKISQPVKDTAATIKRMKKRIQLAEQEEVEWFNNVMNCKNTAKIEELQEFDRQENERERLLDIEKKHLMGQISYEEALLAKQRVLVENKKKYEQFLKEKEMWNEEIDNWRKNEMKKNRKQMEKLSMLELNVLKAKHNTVMKNKETAENFKRQNQILLDKALKDKQDELDRRVKMIKEFKILAIIAKKAKVPKIIDLTETSGFGLLCEMSMAELQERINEMKIGLHDELERKRNTIKEVNEEKKEELKETKKSIESYMNEKATWRKQSKSNTSSTKNASSKEIDDLKKILTEKRKLRMKMSN